MALTITTTGSITHTDIANLDDDGPWSWVADYRRDSAVNLTNDLFDLLKKGANCYLYCSSNQSPNGMAAYDGTGGEARVSSSNLITTSFQHLGCTNAGTSSTPLFYIDGVAQTMAGAAQTYTDVGTAVLQWTGNSGVAVGIANFKMWEAQLTAAEILQEKESFRPVRTANLLVWASYDDATTGTDYSGNGFTGTVTGGTQIQGAQHTYGG